jgi:hypothetical protein
MGSLPPEELVHAIFPETFGFERPVDVPMTYHHRAEGYVGRGISYWEDCFYIGIPVFLLALGAGRSRRGWVWWVLTGCAIAFMLGPITPLFGVFRFVPGAEWFRFPVRAAMWLVLAASQLAALGVDRLGAFLHARPERAGRRASLVLIAVSAGLLLAGGLRLGLDAVREPLGDALTHALVRPAVPPPDDGSGLPGIEARGPEEAGARARGLISELERDVTPWSSRVAWPALLGTITAGIFLLAARGRLSAGGPGRLLPGLVFIDLLVFGLDFNPRTPVEEVVERPASAVTLLGMPGVFRTAVLDRRVDNALDGSLLSSNLGLLWGAEDVIIPSPLRTVRNEAWLAKTGLDLAIVDPDEQVRAFEENRRLADLAGVRFVYTTRTLNLPDLALVWEDGTTRVYENARAMPRAFAVGCTRKAAGPDEALAAVLALADPREAAIVEGEGLSVCVPGEAGTVVIAERTRQSSLTMTVDMNREGWLVVTESAYPGMVFEVDGVPVDPVRTDDLFQGVRLGPGHHEVVLSYLPIPLYLAMVASCVVSGVVFGWIAPAFRRKVYSVAPKEG